MKLWSPVSLRIVLATALRFVVLCVDVKLPNGSLRYSSPDIAERLVNDGVDLQPKQSEFFLHSIRAPLIVTIAPILSNQRVSDAAVSESTDRECTKLTKFPRQRRFRRRRSLTCRIAADARLKDERSASEETVGAARAPQSGPVVRDAPEFAVRGNRTRQGRVLAHQ
jgi:hypothetical protein